jgi:glycosyltransferase involved in cell wall biosynthesis
VRRRLLIITYYSPPDTSVGGARWAAMSEWLRQMGHEVTILTSRASGSLPDDGPWLRRTGDLAAADRLRVLLKRGTLDSTRAGAIVQTPAPSLFTDVLVPDEHLLTWVSGAVASARRLVRERAVDCVVSSGPPNSVHLLPFALGRHRPAWIGDFRDGWRFEPLRAPWPTSAQDRLDAYLERRVVASAEAVIGATRPIADDLRGRLGANSRHVPNGWNPALDSRTQPTRRAELASQCLNIVHTGTLSGSWGRDPAPLLAALRRLAENHPERASRLRLVLAGRLTTEEQCLLAESGVERIVEHVGRLDRDAVHALQREADVLLLITSPVHTSEATGKLFEYLGAGRPIIALAANNEAARIVRETGTGVTVGPYDVEGIEAALNSALDGTLAAAYAPRGLDAYIYPRPAEQVAELVEEAIARRRA